MKRRISFLPIVAALLLLCVAGAVWLMTRNPPPSAGEGPLAGSDIGGPFQLVDQDGRSTTQDSFAGKYRLMYFGYTYCPDVCPTDMQKMAQGYRMFVKSHPERAEDVEPIFVTVDPARDNPEAVKQFVSAFDPAIVGLTGTQAQIDAVLKEYRVYARKQGAADASDYLVDHSVVMYLMGPKGEPISFLAADASPEDIAQQLDRYVS